MGGMGGMGNRRLFVSGLNYQTTWQQIKDLFKQVRKGRPAGWGRAGGRPGCALPTPLAHTPAGRPPC